MDASAYVTVGLLSALCVAAALALRLVRRRAATTGTMRVVERLALEPRRALVLVDVAGRRFLVGVGEGPLTMLAELGPAESIAPVESQPQPKQPPLSLVNDEPLVLKAWRRVVGGR